MEHSQQPARYLTPYILWLGIADWLKERGELSHREALAEIAEGAPHQGLRVVQRLAMGALLLALLVWFVTHAAAPAMQALATDLPASSVLLLSALLAEVSLAAIGFLLVRGGYRRYARVYARGLKVWQQRQQALYKL